MQKSEVEDLEFLLTETSKILMKDYDSDFFSDYTPYTTSFGMDLKKFRMPLFLTICMKVCIMAMLWRRRELF
jgi:Golgi nucleoside diphosphatase